MRTASIIINAVIFVATFAIVISHFREDGVWRFRSGLKQFRFFTNLSNILCAIAALLMAFSQIGSEVSQAVFMLKYLGTVSLTLTFLTVLLFLAPFHGGFAKWFGGEFFYTHLVGPLLAILSFCMLEKRPMSLGTAMMGLIPMLLYGAVYLYKIRLAPEEKRWEDFYGFNRNGMWMFSGVVMIVGASLICLAYWRVCRM